MEIKFTDADGFEREAAGADLAVLLIQREDIEALRVGSTVERLLLLSDRAEHVHRFAGRLLLRVSGYDDDPRPLSQVPECVRFFRAVDRQWGYWLHFIMPEPEELMFILFMLLDVRWAASHGGMVGYVPPDPQQFDRVLQRLFSAMRRLQSAFNVPLTHAMAVADAVTRTFGMRAPSTRG